jgi:cytochrome b
MHQPPSTALLGVAARHAGTTSTAAIALAALAALLALGCIGWALVRLTSFEPRWAQSVRHAMAEAAFRASATWAEFSDWVRLGH